MVFKCRLENDVVGPDVLQVLVRDFHSADRTLLLLRKREIYLVSKLVRLLLAGHKPVSIDAEQMEAMEAVVNSGQVVAVSELLKRQLRVIFAKLFEADRASSHAGVILLRQNLSELFVDVVDHLLFLLLWVAMLIQALLNLLPQFIDLVVVQSLVLNEFKHWRLLRVL